MTFGSYVSLLIQERIFEVASTGDGGVVLQEQCTSISPFLLQQSDTPYLFLMRRNLV